MRHQLLFVFLTICYLSQAQEIELQKLKSTIDSIDLLISKNEQKIKLLNDENNKMLVKMNLIISRRNEIFTSNEIGEIYVCIMGNVIYEKPNGTYDLARLKMGDRVKVIETNDGLCKVLFNGIKGFVWKNTLISELDWNLEIQKKEKADSLKRIEEEKAKQIRIANDIQREKNETISAEKRKISVEKRKNELIKKYGKTIGLKVFDEKIWIGMTKEMLFESWGRPNDINRTLGSWGVHEQCIYTSAYVYIENGVVTSWQD